MYPRGTRVTWQRPGLPSGEGAVEQSREAHANRVMYEVRDDHGTVYWFPEDALTEANS